MVRPGAGGRKLHAREQYGNYCRRPMDKTHLGIMRDRILTFEDMLEIAIGKVPTEKGPGETQTELHARFKRKMKEPVFVGELMRMGFENVIKGREEMLLITQRGIVEEIRSVLRKPKVTVGDLFQILQQKTCALKQDPDRKRR